MGILDPAKLAVVFIIAFLVLGPERLPGIARRLGSTMRQVSEFRDHAEREIRESVAGVDIASVTKLGPAQLASWFVDDLVEGEGAPVSSTLSRAPLEPADDGSAMFNRAPQHEVGLGRIFALSEPSDLDQSESQRGLTRGTGAPDTVLMN